MKESVVECLKNAKTVLDAVGPLVLEHDKKLAEYERQKAAGALK